MGGEQREGNRGIDVGNYAIGQSLGIDFTPAYGFGGCRTAKAASVGTGVGALKKIVMAFFLDAHDFLNLRLGLAHEILWRAAAENEYGRVMAGGLCFVYDGGRFGPVAV